MPYRSATIDELAASIRLLGGTVPPFSETPTEVGYRTALYWVKQDLLRIADPPADPSSAPWLPEGSSRPL